MKRRYCYISLFYFFAFFPGRHLIAQSKRSYNNNELSFQYGISVKGIMEFSLNNALQKPVYRLCINFGLGSNILARALYLSINGELQLYNGGLGSRRRPDNKVPHLTADLINSFTLTTGLNNYLTGDSLPVIVRLNRNVPLYYFSNFCFPALQNPYDYSISAGTDFIISSDKLRTSQRVGFLNLHINKVQLSYYNDGGTPLDEIYLGDSKDRYYTGGALISYNGNSRSDINLAELSFQKFTGYSKNAFEVSNKLDLAFVNYNNPEEKYFNKSCWSLNISNPEKGVGININRYNYTNWDIQHLIHFGIFNSYHLVPYGAYYTIGGNYYYDYTNIGLR